MDSQLDPVAVFAHVDRAPHQGRKQIGAAGFCAPSGELFITHRDMPAAAIAVTNFNQQGLRWWYDRACTDRDRASVTHPEDIENIAFDDAGSPAHTVLGNLHRGREGRSASIALRVCEQRQIIGPDPDDVLSVKASEHVA
jgi:hypothetical protein